MKNRNTIALIAVATLILGGVFIYLNKGGSTKLEAFSTDTAGLNSTIPTATIELKNGDSYTMTASIVKKIINGQEVRMLAYNGSIPGPIIKVQQGSEVTIILKNNTDVETSLHPHGLRLDSANDGVVPMDQPAIKPGDSYTYKIKFPDAGVFWYHPHIREEYTQASGLYGNFIVKPIEANYWSQVNQEIPLTIGDILLQNGNIAPFSTTQPDHTLMGRFGNTMLVNGNTNYNLSVQKGEVVRFYITNVANVRPFNITIPGAKIKLVGADNGKYEKEAYVDGVILAPGERAIIEVLFDKAGTYNLENKTPDKTYTLGSIMVSDQVVKTSYFKEFSNLRTNSDVVSDISNFTSYFGKPADKKVTLTLDMNMGSMNGMHMMSGGEMMKSDGSMMSDTKTPIEWEDSMAMMNESSTPDSIKWKIVEDATGKSGSDINWTFKKGDKVKVEIFNDPKSMHPMQHPIHFHGQRFLVLSTNGVKNTNLVWKDTALIKTGDRVDILIDMSNPGDWMAHCHISEHLEAGMMLNFKVE